MIALFVLKLSAGITLMWWLMPRREVTDGFFRIQMRLVLGLAVLAILLLSQTGTWDLSAVVAESSTPADGPSQPTEPVESSAARTWQWMQRAQIGLAVVAYVGSVFWALGRRLPGNICIHLMTVISCGSVLLHSLRVPCSCTWLQVLSDFSSAAVCGSVLTAMLLGHWYLTTPTMSTRPLYWFNGMIIVAAGLRLVASATAVLTEGLALPGLTHWIWFSIRCIGSIAVPLIVSIAVWRVLRYRNTQSATGILFAGLILVLMGEMSGALLERDLQIPY